MLQPEASRGQPLAGFTLLEVSLILAIGTAAATAGLKLYQGHKQALDLQVSETRIKTMFQALGSFYAMHCLTVANSQGQAKATPEPLLSSEILVNLGLLSSVENSKNPFGGGFSPSINWGSPVTVSVSANYGGTLNVWAPHQLPPTEQNDTLLNGTSFKWTHLASDIAYPRPTEEQLYSAMYHPQKCR